ncbi:precorrin-6y C5,15-methyltransferase (decarboxylating) subunit CbiE [Ancylomarina sp. 16SWW S1-10-2]|uniref:precorrin-6y C5,15-methyltransferase (decarboxylating) subunit CbiE n=1 Tax=Ancylomarina sp. 16SWW S1-10-2 TaxID=2499681 RepID=UPI0012AD81ED|nr:precorrin-6y C5,15-methyltransferase (decarboxylating) subunit CbiE [Ancylomarina sp. 16SWW S1-10-2]MRT94626.1 precorrin-6y C5,15-methyltransferase (decarboxylating) subunit CbiE [Ancylomarina sp. 16SWW S1-10-2]
MKITIIGISDIKPEFSEKEISLIHSVKHFAGGSRHRELVTEFLPEGFHWQNIVVPLSNLYEAIETSKQDWLVFASGDPLFYGIGITLMREFPDAEITISPDFNSLQLLAHRFKLPYGEFQTVTLTGRSFEKFDQALIKGTERMGILTDRKNTPKTIAQRMLQYGYSNYKMYYGERLGGEKERVMELNLEEALSFDFNHPNCFYLEKTNDLIPRKGISESDFEPLEGRPKMITKMAIRLSTLALMELHSKKVFWDVGACTGSVSVETRLNHPHIKVKSFEIRKESEGIIQRNAQKFQTPGIEVFIGDYLQIDKSEIDKPDAVFLGGYGGKMDEVLDDIHLNLNAEGILAFNSVSEKSRHGFINWCERNAYQKIYETVVSVDEFNPITILVARKTKKSQLLN